ncbi:MAG: acyl-CoA reductase [Ferruginibacter sp.]
MNLQERIELLKKLGDYLKQNTVEWQQAKLEAFQKNPWFTTKFIDTATENILHNYLESTALEKWVKHYHLDDNVAPKNVGIVMAGNIPMVGFHDLLSVFITGHRQTIKLSSKDEVLLKFLVKKMSAWNIDIQNVITFGELLKGCYAYIATGSNNSARYFDEYFAKYPHIIRRNKTSVAILKNDETSGELEKLSNDIHLYFGLGCRNVTKLYVPKGYDFVPLIRSFDKYSYFLDQHKYKNNYDYQLSIMLLNKVYYMTNGSTLLAESDHSFSPISVVNYEFYEDEKIAVSAAMTSPDIQCVVGKDLTSFGLAQCPNLFAYADGVDTIQFLLSL